MRKLGYILLLSGFVWVVFFAVEANPIARAASRADAQKLSDQPSYTRRDVEIALWRSAYQVADFASFGFVGGLLMLAGGIILGRLGRQNSVPAEPPILKG